MMATLTLNLKKDLNVEEVKVNKVKKKNKLKNKSQNKEGKAKGKTQKMKSEKK